MEDNLTNKQSFNDSMPEMNAQYPINNKKEKRTVSAGIVDFVAAIITFIATYFTIHYADFGITFTIGYILLFLCASVYMIIRGGRLSPSAILTGLTCIVASISLSLYADFVINVAVIAMLMYLSCEYCLLLCNAGKYSGKSYFRLLDLFRGEFVIPLKNLFLPGRSLIKSNSNGKKMGGIFIGLICAVPVLAVVIPLLISSDAAFENLMTDIIDRIGGYIFIAIVSLIVTVFVFSTMFSFASGVTREDNLKYKDFAITKMRIVGNGGIIGFLGVISLVYIVYLFSQLSYIFGAFTGHMPGGMVQSLSEYARRGFFEMSAVAGINFLLITLGILFSKRDGGKISKAIKGFDLFLSFFTILLIAAAMAKMALYINEFGLTRKRIFVTAFIVVLFVWFVAVIIRLFKENFPYYKVMVACACVVLMILAFANVNTIIVKYNTDAYLSGKIKTLDVETIGDSDCYAGLQSLYKITENPDEKYRDDAINKLVSIYRYECSQENLNIFKLGNLDSYRYNKFIGKTKNNLKEKAKEICGKYCVEVTVYSDNNVKSISVNDGQNTDIVKNDKLKYIAHGEGHMFFIDSACESVIITATDIDGNTISSEIDLSNYYITDSILVDINDEYAGGLVFERINGSDIDSLF